VIEVKIIDDSIFWQSPSWLTALASIFLIIVTGYTNWLQYKARTEDRKHQKNKEWADKFSSTVISFIQHTSKTNDTLKRGLKLAILLSNEQISKEDEIELKRQNEIVYSDFKDANNKSYEYTLALTLLVDEKIEEHKLFASYLTDWSNLAFEWEKYYRDSVPNKKIESSLHERINVLRKKILQQAKILIDQSHSI
jgi:hypothetical protein